MCIRDRGNIDPKTLGNVFDISKDEELSSLKSSFMLLKDLVNGSLMLMEVFISVYSFSKSRLFIVQQNIAKEPQP